jgi:hypothetical protein
MYPIVSALTTEKESRTVDNVTANKLVNLLNNKF